MKPFSSLFFAALLLALPFSTAQGGRGVVVEQKSIVAAIDDAALEVILAAPLLRSPSVARALKNTYERGVPVYLVTASSTVLDPRSYWGSLGLAGLSLFTVPRVRGYELVIDGRVYFSGPLVALPPTARHTPTYRYQDDALAKEKRRQLALLLRSKSASRMKPAAIVTLMLRGGRK